MKNPVQATVRKTVQIYVKKNSLSAIYSSNLETTTNASFSVGTHHFSGMRDFLAGLAPEAKAAAGNFGTQAKYWQDIGFDSHAQVSIAELNDGLSVYERYVEGQHNSKQNELSSDDIVLLAKLQMVDLSLKLPKSESSSLALASPTAAPSSPPVVNGPPPAQPTSSVAGTFPPPVYINDVHSERVVNGSGNGALVRVGSQTQTPGQTTPNAPPAPPAPAPQPNPTPDGCSSGVCWVGGIPVTPF